MKECKPNYRRMICEHGVFQVSEDGCVWHLGPEWNEIMNDGTAIELRSKQVADVLKAAAE